MTYSPEIQLPPHMAEKARRAALLGTRALIVNEHFDALVSLLVCAGAVPVERASGMVTALADKLTGYRSGHPEYRIASAELDAQSARLRAFAVSLSSGGVQS